MGLLISRFRKKKTSEELLENIQKNIEKLENDSKLYLQREKAIVFRLIFFSVLVYIVAALLFYFYFFPASLWDRLFYMIPLLTFPIIIIIVKRFITWLYHRDIKNSKDKLKNLHIEKKKILDDVMNTETYKKAKEILDKYAPDQLRKSPVPTTPPNLNSGNVGLNKTPVKDKKLEGFVVQPSTIQRNIVSSTPIMRVSPNQVSRPVPPSRRLPRPLLPQDRGYLDRFVEYIVGDGPNNRYALICKNCSSHNGMALKEEFEYLSFRCAYCGFPNPSLKVRPRDMPAGFTPLNLPPQENNSQQNQADERRSPSTEREAESVKQVEETNVAKEMEENQEGDNLQSEETTDEKEQTIKLLESERLTNEEEEDVETKKTQ